MTPPARSAPPPARQAFRLMLIGAALQGLLAVIAIADFAGIKLRTAHLAHDLQHRTLSGAELDSAARTAYWFTVGTQVAFVVMWLFVANACRGARGWGRGLATFLAIIYLFTFVFSGWPSPSVTTAIQLALGAVAVCVVYLLWRRSVGLWMTSATSSASLRSSSTEES